MKPLFIFPVKECSTRLPGKNLLEINGKPLFMYPFEAMLKAASNFKDSLSIITTESFKIIDKATSVIADYLHQTNNGFISDLRPLEYAKDPYQMGDVCKYVMDKYKIEDYGPLVVVQSTLPFTTADDILKCIELYKPPVNSVRVFREVNKQWKTRYHSVHKIVASLLLHYNVYDGIKYNNLQSLGGIVVCKSEFVKLKGSFPQAAVPYIMPKERAFDVDDETDFICAKALMEKGNGNSSVRTCN